MRISRRILLTTLRTGLLAALMMGNSLLSAAPPEGKGNNKDDGGTTEPPPALFELQLYAMPDDYAGGNIFAEEMNESGEVVGFYGLPDGTEQPFYIDVHSGTSVVNLNDLPFDPNYDVPEGWYVYAATGINNWSDISGALALTSDPDQLRGFVLEMVPDPTDPTVLPRLHLIPDGAWTHTYARRINDAGEVLGRGDSLTSYIYRPGLHGLAGDTEVEVLPFEFDAWYAHLNNPTESHDTEIVAWSGSIGEHVHYTLGDANASIIDLDISDVRGLSDSGSFCGTRNIRKKKQIGYVYDGVLTDLSEVTWADSVNASEDVLGTTSSREPVLFHATHGILDLNELAVASSSSEQDLWDNSDKNFNGMTERNVAGTDPAVADFPAAFGSLLRYDTSLYEVYVLLPIPVP